MSALVIEPRSPLHLCSNLVLPHHPKCSKLQKLLFKGAADTQWVDDNGQFIKFVILSSLFGNLLSEALANVFLSAYFESAGEKSDH